MLTAESHPGTGCCTGFKPPQTLRCGLRLMHIFGVARTLILAFAVSQAALGGQISHTLSTRSETVKLFGERCGGCHGQDAKGTDQGPALAGRHALRGRSEAQIRQIIKSGIPTSGMPAFNLPAPQLEALAAFVHSLNAPAAETPGAGDPAAGEKFFFSKGRCSSCHMVSGEGQPVGPDLSDTGREMTLDEIRESLLHPGKRIAAGYKLVSVRLRTGEDLRGFARNQSDFDVELQDFSGRFHLLHEQDVSEIRYEKRSLMPPVRATQKEFEDLIAYLSRLTGVKPGVLVRHHSSESSESPTGLDFAKIRNPTPGDWLTYNGNLDGNRYSELAQINVGNVNRLTLKWGFSVPLWKQLLPDSSYFEENMQYFGLETTPLVTDGIMYVTGPHSCFALDALTGREIWEYSRPRTPGLVGDAALGTNRGVAILNDKVFMVTDNAHLVALNRTTGRPVWEMAMPHEPQHYGSTVAPLAVKDLVIAGVSGGDWGIRGFIAAYKAATGEPVWRFWTVPGNGDPGYETWKGTAVKYGGGATWLTGSYDPETNTIFWCTGNPFPDSDDSERGGDNLFTNCVLALDADTGRLKWHYQFSPHDVHDWDATVPNVLVDTAYRGQARKLLLHADRNGFFYVFDRNTGELLLATKFINRVTWASGIGRDGRPQLLRNEGVTCPDVATNWNATAFSPVARLYYVMALEKCIVDLVPGRWKTQPAPEEPGKKYLRALDIETGRIVWEDAQSGPTEGKRVAGVLATAGGIVFYGNPTGDLVAVDARNGKPLWHFSTAAVNKTSPITYSMGGKQFVAFAAGADILCFGLPQ